MNTLKIISVAIAICLVPTIALAEETTEREMLKQHCTGDYLTHCGEFAPDSPEVEECFRVKAKVMSVTCTAAIAFYQKRPNPIRKISATR